MITSVSPVSTVSACVEIPESLYLKMMDYLERNPTQDIHSVVTQALEGFDFKPRQFEVEKLDGRTVVRTSRGVFGID